VVGGRVALGVVVVVDVVSTHVQVGHPFGK